MKRIVILTALTFFLSFLCPLTAYALDNKITDSPNDQVGLVNKSTKQSHIQCYSAGTLILDITTDVKYVQGEGSGNNDGWVIISESNPKGYTAVNADCIIRVTGEKWGLF